MVNKRVERVRKYLAEGKDYKRWRMWKCVLSSNREKQQQEADKTITYLNSKGFKAKVWAPLPEHKTSEHRHIVVLSTFHELCELAGIPLSSC